MTADQAMNLLALGVLKDSEQIPAAIAWHEERKNRTAAWDDERELLKRQVHQMSDRINQLEAELKRKGE